MRARDKIITVIRKKSAVSGPKIANQLGITRQAVNKQIKLLLIDGLIVKTGSTHNSLYFIPGTVSPEIAIEKTVPIKNLEEDKVFKEIDLRLNMKKACRKNVYDILYFAFTEMLNNAIEHSGSKTAKIMFERSKAFYRFMVRDSGIGLFSSIADKTGLPNEEASITELLKGKTTTMKKHHTGEGIFFTSRIGDLIRFSSHRTTLTFDTVRKDLFITTRKFLSGTEVEFKIAASSRRQIGDITKTYAPEEYDYKFMKTEVMVRLYQSEFISRSEARRLLAGLDRFRTIVLDFKDVKTIGRGFADEIFRIFRRNHPEIRIQTKNLSPAQELMIRHVVDN